MTAAYHVMVLAWMWVWSTALTRGFLINLHWWPIYIVWLHYEFWVGCQLNWCYLYTPVIFEFFLVVVLIGMCKTLRLYCAVFLLFLQTWSLHSFNCDDDVRQNEYCTWHDTASLSYKAQIRRVIHKICSCAVGVEVYKNIEKCTAVVA